jgi:hypothetical protein
MKTIVRKIMNWWLRPQYGPGCYKINNYGPTNEFHTNGDNVFALSVILVTLPLWIVLAVIFFVSLRRSGFSIVGHEKTTFAERMLGAYSEHQGC